MADRELKRLSRRELLEMLIAQGRENERLQAEITQLEALLNEREIRLEKSGNIAEAALRLNGIFEAAQRAADQYLENISKGDIRKSLIGKEAEFFVADAQPEPPEAASEAPEHPKPDPWRELLPDMEAGEAPEDEPAERSPQEASGLAFAEDDLEKPWLRKTKKRKIHRRNR